MRFSYEQEDGEEAEEEVMVVGSTRNSSKCNKVGWGPYERVARMASGNAVVVFSVSGCCMCHVVKRLLLGLGVGPIVYELDQLDDGAGAVREIQAVLSQLLHSSSALPSTSSAAGGSSTATTSSSGAVVPAVFIGGKLLGGVEKVMACHINGSLVPLLKQAGALWL